MSRIGKKPIPLPKGVEVRQEGNTLTVKGPKGTLSTAMIQGIDVEIENNVVEFKRHNDEGMVYAPAGALVRGYLRCHGHAR